MRLPNARLGLRAVLPVVALAVVACGDSAPSVPQAATSPLIGASVSIRQTGDAPVQVVQNSAVWSIDDAKLVNVTVTVHSAAATAVTVTGRASLYDRAGKLVGDATGGQLNVPPGKDIQLKLTGPTPTGTVSSATFEFTTIPAATPIPGGA
jgi:hypothetical protein